MVKSGADGRQIEERKCLELALLCSLSCAESAAFLRGVYPPPFPWPISPSCLSPYRDPIWAPAQLVSGKCSLPLTLKGPFIFRLNVEKEKDAGFPRPTVEPSATPCETKLQETSDAFLRSNPSARHEYL